MLKKQPEGEDDFSLEHGTAPTDGQGENHHGQCGESGHKESKLQRVDEQAPLRGPLAKKGENEGCHAKVGQGAKDGVVALQNTEKAEVDNSQVLGDKVLHKDRNSLDKNVDQGNENSDFYVLKRLQRAIK